jgi:hypothetical protein
MGLGAAKQVIGNFSNVGNTRKRDFLGHGRSGREDGNGQLPKWNGGREERKDERKKERKKSHSELARKSLGGRSEKKKEKEKRVARATTPQDMGV